MTETLADTPVDTPVDTLMETPVVAPAMPEPAAAAPTRKPAGAGARIQGSLPTLEKLAQLYPTLFGAVFLPMKRGIFQDLLSAHPEQFERDALKAALSVHTRSTRYLNAVASGQDRHDLQGLAVEPMAPEHVYQSLLEVFRRRQAKAGEDLSAKLRQRIVQAFVASCLPREAYTALVQSKDETANANLEQAMAEAAEWDAKDEATRRAFEASGLAVEAFADMYGLHPKAVADALSRATRWTQD